MAEDVAEATESLPKEAGLVGLDGPLDRLDLTKILADRLSQRNRIGPRRQSVHFVINCSGKKLPE